MLEMYYNFTDKFSDYTRFAELELDTDSLYLALSEPHWYDCIHPVMKKCGTFCEVETVRMNFQPSQ